ncbi:hypothetical protein PoB_003636900 [Plakobranchus ocellatus]|uniref:Uncharacterized protein n=1 Tax=Plakobranchus ocellatus TaxID=259542 RepID=A0AAV4AU50_9GAST|nr:hypothetical protein PoB_003636900 [Plakobranchus ocellatus]
MVLNIEKTCSASAEFTVGQIGGLAERPGYEGHRTLMPRRDEDSLMRLTFEQQAFGPNLVMYFLISYSETLSRSFDCSYIFCS